MIQRLLIATALTVAIFAPPADAQQRPQRQQTQQQAQPEQFDLEQIELTQKQIDAFIVAQKAITPMTARLKSDKPDPKTLAQMEAVVKQAGFNNMDEFGDVGANIEFVFGGIDPQSKQFSEPEVMIRKEIERLNADTKVPPGQKRRILQEMQRALQSAPKLKYAANVDVVAKNYDPLKAVMEEPAPAAPPAGRQR